MTPDTLSATFAALADPTRRALLARLAQGEATVKELAQPFLAEPFSITLPAVSRHLKVLERAGLITQGRRAQWRPCQIAAAPLRDAAAYLSLYRQLWEARFDRLDHHLSTLDEGEPAP